MKPGLPEYFVLLRSGAVNQISQIKWIVECLIKRPELHACMRDLHVNGKHGDINRVAYRLEPPYRGPTIAAKPREVRQLHCPRLPCVKTCFARTNIKNI